MIMSNLDQLFAVSSMLKFFRDRDVTNHAQYARFITDDDVSLMDRRVTDDGPCVSPEQDSEDGLRSFGIFGRAVCVLSEGVVE